MKEYKDYKKEFFFWGDRFIRGHDDLIQELAESQFNEDDTEEGINLPDNWSIEIQGAELEPIIKIDADILATHFEEMGEHRFSEFGYESEVHEITELAKACFDFEKFKKECPKLYYASGGMYKVTRTDVIEDLREWLEE
jgi:hypothetical protein